MKTEMSIPAIEMMVDDEEDVPNVIVGGVFCDSMTMDLVFAVRDEIAEVLADEDLGEWKGIAFSFGPGWGGYEIYLSGESTDEIVDAILPCLDPLIPVDICLDGNVMMTVLRGDQTSDGMDQRGWMSEAALSGSVREFVQVG